MTMNLTWHQLTETAEYRQLAVRLRERAAAIRSRLAPRRAESDAQSPVPIDLVFQGGGMLGLAHLGALDALEQVGLVPRHVAGTSAGSIVATLLFAQLRSRQTRVRVAARLFDDLRSMPTTHLLDGPAAIRALFRGDRRTGRQRAFDVVRALPAVLHALRRRYGLHPGRVFSNWLDERLERCGIRCVDDLLPHAAGGRILRVVACGLPGGVKFVLPDDLTCFAVDPKDAPPSLLARASMAIPLVFTPLQWALDRQGWPRHLARNLASTFPVERRRELAAAPRMLLFDGGMFSNLPVDILPNAPGDDTPTVAIALYSSSQATTRISVVRRGRSLLRVLMELIDGMRALRDREARSVRAGDGRMSVVWIDTRDADWLDFSADPAAARQLYVQGMSAIAEI